MEMTETCRARMVRRPALRDPRGVFFSNPVIF